jgi:hypothetical protein
MKEYQKEVIKAWIDGETIQWQLNDGSWYDAHAFGDCNRVYFNDDVVYRIKPVPVVTETLIETYIGYQGDQSHATYSDTNVKKNLRLTWEDNKLVKAEVI